MIGICATVGLQIYVSSEQLVTSQLDPISSNVDSQFQGRKVWFALHIFVIIRLFESRAENANGMNEVDVDSRIHHPGGESMEVAPSFALNLVVQKVTSQVLSAYGTNQSDRLTRM